MDGFEYCGSWYKRMIVPFAESKNEIDVQIYGYDEDKIPENGVAALTSFLSDFEKYTEDIGKSILDYYQKRRIELGFDIEENADYPDIENVNQILNTLSLIGLTIPDQDDYDGRAVFLVFNCTWDKENGVGVCLIDDNVDEVGDQTIAL